MPKKPFTCSTCGKSYYNPLTHTCKMRFTPTGARRIEKKHENAREKKR